MAKSVKWENRLNGKIAYMGMVLVPTMLYFVHEKSVKWELTIGVNSVRGRLPSDGPRGGGVPTVPLFGSRFWRENSKTAAKFKKWARKFKNSKNFPAFGRMIRGDPYLFTAASRPGAVLSSANLVRPRGGGYNS